MNTQDLIAKLKPYPIAVAALALALVAGVFFYFRMMSLEEQSRRHESLTTEWKKMEDNVFKNSVNLETHLESVKSITQDAERRLIIPSELARNYQYFYRLEASTGVEIISLQQQPAAPEKPAPKGSSKAKAPDPLFSKTGYTMTVSGAYNDLLTFFHVLQHGESFYQLKNFTLQPVKEANERRLSVTLNFDLLSVP